MEHRRFQKNFGDDWAHLGVQGVEDQLRHCRVKLFVRGIIAPIPHLRVGFVISMGPSGIRFHNSITQYTKGYGVLLSNYTLTCNTYLLPCVARWPSG